MQCIFINTLLINRLRPCWKIFGPVRPSWKKENVFLFSCQLGEGRAESDDRGEEVKSDRAGAPGSVDVNGVGIDPPGGFEARVCLFSSALTSQTNFQVSIGLQRAKVEETARERQA